MFQFDTLNNFKAYFTENIHFNNYDNTMALYE